MNRPVYVIVHHSATPDGGARDLDAIRRFHMSFRHEGNIITPEEAAARRAAGHKDVLDPWSDIGYHYVVEAVAGKGVLFEPGRRVDKAGAHCSELGMNAKSIGVCAVGNFDVAAPSLALYEFLTGAIFGLLIQHSIPVNNVLGHREVGLRAGFDWTRGQFKSCPGKLFSMDILRGKLGQRIARDWPSPNPASQPAAG